MSLNCFSLEDSFTRFEEEGFNRYEFENKLKKASNMEFLSYIF